MLGIDDAILIGIAYGIGKVVYYVLKAIYEKSNGN